jgi:hypothetical protein
MTPHPDQRRSAPSQTRESLGPSLPALGAVGIALVAALAWPSEACPAEPTRAPAAAAPSAAQALLAERTQRATIAEPAPMPPADLAAEPPLRFGSVELRAVDAADGTGLPRFRWSLSPAPPGYPASGLATGYAALLRVPLEQASAVRVEADGHAPSLAVDVGLRGGATHRTATAHLAAAAAEPGVALRVVDDFGRAVTRVRITCATPVPEAGSGNAWRMRWTRDSTAADGVHRIATAERGRHRFGIVALDERGAARPFAPAVQTLVLDGARVVEHLQELRSTPRSTSPSTNWSPQ